MQSAGVHASPEPLTHLRSGVRPFGSWLAAWSIGVLLRAACVAALKLPPAWDGVIYERAAEHLAQGAGYTQRILEESAPAKATAFFPPGFPAVLSVLHRIAGGSALDPWFQVLLSSAFIPAAWFLGRRLAGPRAGRFAAWLMAFWPGGILLSASWFTEPVFTVLLCAACLGIAYARTQRRLRTLLIAAAVMGLAAYVRPTALAVVPLLGAVTGYTQRAPNLRSRVRRTLSWAALASALAMVPLLPWMLRNQAALGHPVLVSTNGGYNLLVGTLGEGSYGSLTASFDCPPGLKEVPADQCRSQRAMERIRQDPLAWLARGVLKVVHTVGHDSAPAQLISTARAPNPRDERIGLVALALCRAFWLPFLSLAGTGLLFALQRARLRRLLLLYAAPVVGMLLLHFIYIGGDRYHAPLAPFFAAFAGLSLTRIFPRSTSSVRS